LLPPSLEGFAAFGELCFFELLAFFDWIFDFGLAFGCLRTVAFALVVAFGFFFGLTRAVDCVVVAWVVVACVIVAVVVVIVDVV
jgi:hypothetical protein